MALVFTPKKHFNTVKLMRRTAWFLLICCFSMGKVFGGNIVFNDQEKSKNIGSYLELLNDHDGKYSENTIINATGFHSNTEDMPVFSSLNVNIWARFSVVNNSDVKNIFFNVDHFNTSVVKIYKESNGKLNEIYVDGNAIVHSSRNNLPDYIANLQLPKDSTATYYLHIESYHPVVLNVNIGTYDVIERESNKQFVIIIFYLGILLAIFFYNLFLFIATKDRSYLLYILYIFFLGFAQFTLSGYTFKYLWYAYPAINYYAVAVSSTLAMIFGVWFSTHFLRTKHYSPFFHKALSATIIFGIIAIIASLIHLNSISYSLLVVMQFFAGLLIITAAIIIILKGYKPALFYAISWILFLSGIIIFSLRNFSILPANGFTNYIVYVGSAIETILLSIALADRINVLKKEKEESHEEALRQAREKEQIVSQQNIMLEEKVNLRTKELQDANLQLNEALNNLKDTQTQLVDAEKMASLGQLTAGIAHEINNPINFVKSNINPLRLDIGEIMSVLTEYDKLHTAKDEDSFRKKLYEIEEMKNELEIDFLQKEVNNLILGIEDGAERTAEIVRGLRTFSRIDEAAIKKVNVHDGINSTIVLLKNSMPHNLQITREFNADGNIECFPGKLNQVFMNILTNAIQAIKAKPVMSNEEVIAIETIDIDSQIQISIKDSGIGMTDDVKHHIFEPFFTTKDIGEGTGLGMAIVYKIVQKHSGKINIISSPGEGAEFIITLPYHQDISNY
jgi:signal transduction histidine kinase